MAAAELLWKPLLEAAGQTMTGVLGSYAFDRLKDRFFQRNSFDGAMDLWHRGIHGRLVGENDAIRFEGLVSPYTQLFPGDPFANGRRWNGLHSFSGRISSAEYQSLEFYAGSDAALRVGTLNGESLVGLYAQYGFIGDGVIGVASTKQLLSAFPDFFSREFVGGRAIVKGRLARCPSQHGFIAQSIAQRAGIELDLRGYKSLWYVQISSISAMRGVAASSMSLLGSLWAATDVRRSQYLLQYGYISNKSERDECIANFQREQAWSHARVYCDELTCPSEELSFRRAFL